MSEEKSNCPVFRKDLNNMEEQQSNTVEQSVYKVQPGQAVRRRRARRSNPDNCAYKVEIAGFPWYTQREDLERILQKFGTLQIERIRKSSAVIGFKEKASANAAVADNNINVYGSFLSAKHYTSDIKKISQKSTNAADKRTFERSKEKATILHPVNIDFSGSFHTQLDVVLTSIRLTREEVESLVTLYTDLQNVLQSLWPGCVAIPFGSITTGLAIKTSDADCFVHIPAQYRHGSASYVNRAKRVLQNNPQIFTEIISIPRANTPIVKFFHIPTKTNCDISFKTPLGVRNSNLIKLLLHSDPRLIPVAITIKYWAKVHELSRSGRISNYTLMTLLIFYLQQSPLYVLPSVLSLQTNVNVDDIVDNWCTSINNDATAFPKSSNTSSISELLGGFFEYYASFDFEKMVVCPYLGQPIEKKLFTDLNALPPQFALYKRNVLSELCYPIKVDRPVCVQDPFEQSHNIASCISYKFYNEIKAYIKFAADAYGEEKQNNCQHFLENILIKKPKILKLLKTECRINFTANTISTIPDADWKERVRGIIFNIFNDILKINLVKNKKINNKDTNKIKEKYSGSLNRFVWKRKTFERIYTVMTLPFLEKQIKITEEILKVNKDLTNIKFTLILTYCEEPKNFVLHICYQSGEMNSFKDFSNFLIIHLHGWFVKLLKIPPQLTAEPVTEETNDIDTEEESECENIESDVSSEENSKQVVDNPLAVVESEVL